MNYYLALLLLLACAIRSEAGELSLERSNQSTAPLFEGLGDHRHPVTADSRKAQLYFDQGLTLCFAFNHTEAIRSFRGALRQDPHCAMAYWGIAYANGPHVNRLMSKEDNDRAWEALQHAVELKDRANANERAYIGALEKRYQPLFTEDRSRLDKDYAAAMREMIREFPDDLDAYALFSEALMDTMPWDYWLKDRSPKPETEEALAALRYVIARNPDHPGANHFFIHAVEAGPHPEQGIPSADRLLRFAPRAGHLVHMPSHIYMRVGQYEDAELANALAVKADRAYIQHCAAQGFYPGAYYPHNEHFLWYAAYFQGRLKESLSVSREASALARENYCGSRKVIEAPRLRHLPWLTLARFGKWDEVLKIEKPAATNDFFDGSRDVAFCQRIGFCGEQGGGQCLRGARRIAEVYGESRSRETQQPSLPRQWCTGCSTALACRQSCGSEQQQDARTGGTKERRCCGRRAAVHGTRLLASPYASGLRCRASESRKAWRRSEVKLDLSWL